MIPPCECGHGHGKHHPSVLFCTAIGCNCKFYIADRSFGLPDCTCGHRPGHHWSGRYKPCQVVGCKCRDFKVPQVELPKDVHRVQINRKRADKYTPALTECSCTCGWNFRQVSTWNDFNAACEINTHFREATGGKSTMHSYQDAQ